MGGMCMLKKIKHSKLVALLLCLTVLLVPITTMARSYAGPEIYMDDYYVYTDTAPIVVGNRTLVPVRAITEALGCQVYWYPNLEEVDILTPNGNLLMSMYVDDYFAEVYYDYGYELVYMDAAARVYNGRVMVPLRFIAEAFGLEVYYDNYTGDIYMYSPAYIYG